MATENLYVVTHVDLMPPHAAAGLKLLLQFASESMHDHGCIRFEVLQEPSRRNHLTLVEVWETASAFEEHESSQHTRSFREKLHPMLGSPYDQRLHRLAAE